MLRTRHYIYALVAVMMAVTSCKHEDALENIIDFTSPYVIEDNPNDPIQHHRYLIYKEYGVPVFFNDTIGSKYIGMSYDGEELYRYETLDLRWEFSSYNRNTDYNFNYITDPETQEIALLFVDEFLKNASKPMRPFSIFLTEDLEIKTQKGTETPEFYSGFRTLVIPNVKEIEADKVNDFSMSILRSMVKAKVMNNTALAEEFGEVSSKDMWYNKLWTDDLGCKWGVPHKSTYWKPSLLWDDAVANQYVWVESFMPGTTGTPTLEDYYAERDLIFSEIGRFGFICGGLHTGGMVEHFYSPENVKEDLDYYVTMMLELGREEFERRYCESSLVNEKYTILLDYIQDELGVEL
ncbi:MAG: hypothetical protein NC311_18100 [Muribaculaceae bacterium]|nr:hypothetical protein [Muribaculaceae bacterium]